MTTKKTRHQRNAFSEAQGLAQVSESYMTATIVLSKIDTDNLTEAAQAHIRTALNVMAYTVSDIGTKYKKATGKTLDLSHVESAFEENNQVDEVINGQV